MKTNTTKTQKILFENLSFLLKKNSLLLVSFFLLSLFGNAQPNPISIENALTGNPKTEWDINGSDSPTIQGFATQISVNTGETIDFKIDVKLPATNYSIKIYRLGYYNGLGARLIVDLGNFSGVAQPTPLYDPITGKTDCSNWGTSTSWNTGTFTTGLYLAKITRADTQASSHIAFVVRNDNGGADMLFKTSDTTWQAYNGYGGNSLYVDNNGIPNFNHATKVSYDRPFNTRGGGGGSGSSEDWLFNAEYPMIRWLERNGYNVSYTTDVDMDKDPKQITPTGANNTYAHKILLSVGHDEYWSLAERTKFENARDAGVHLAFFSGNEVYWKVRWEDNHRTLVCYKEGSSGENGCGTKCDPDPTWTGLWRDGCNYPSAEACDPENALTGQISWGDGNSSIVVPSIYKGLRFWRNTSIAALTDGNSVTLPYGTLGYEFDFEQFASSNPKGRITMSSSFLSGKNHKLSLYKHTSGAWVFGAGTVQWSWGLDEVHDRGNEAPSQDMQQATLNLFTDMGVSPATPQQLPLLVISNPTNTAAPITLISSPVNAADLPSNSSVIITGTATDTDGVVAGVEVSVDGGTTWNVATGTNSWSYSWVPTSQGPVTIKSRAFDDNGNMETAGAGITVTVDEPAPIVCPCSIFPVNSVPQNLSDSDSQAIEVGMKFQSAVDGYITGIRFFKAIGDPGTHIGNLWSASGSLLASVLFVGETASGWQEATFSAPFFITANTTYLISYHSSANYYTSTVGGLNSAVTTGNLTALANGTDGLNGVYIYSGVPAFPTQSYNSSNYWVDVVFNTTATDVTPPAVTQVTPNNNATLVSSVTSIAATFSESIDVETLTFVINNGAVSTNPLVYTSATRTATLTPTNPLAYSTTYTATISSGLEDLAGNTLASDYTWTFTTGPEPQPAPIPAPDGPGGPILIISSAANPFSRYPIEILRAEGINQFKAEDISAITPALLANYEVAILGEMSIDASQAAMLGTWVNTGKTLITLRPDADLYPLLGIASSTGTLSDKYLLFNTTSGPGVGLVNETIQYHSAADLYTLETINPPTVVATLYSTATTATTNPAVLTRTVGTGKVFAFAYDLAKSVVYTRQGNPAWAGQQRDDQNDGNIRSNDLYTGTGADPDWIDFSKVQIPQADEQQRLLSNIITQSILAEMPLPKFWFLPRKLKAAVVMTGDDHGNNGTSGRFDQYLTFGNNTADDVLNWRAIRGTSYIYPNTPISASAALAYQNQGFEIALHLNSGCNVYTQASLENSFTSQLGQFGAAFPGLTATQTHRTHCISWSDWASKPKVEIQKGIRLNTDYYYWPASWVQNRPGMFTGSGMPMRFADIDGTILDNYQVTTQMPDESGLNVANFINTLLTNAKGPKGYYGVFCANMHTDNNNPGDQSVVGSNAIVASAIANEIPVITAKQMLTWLDGRNASTYTNLSYAANTLTFTVDQAAGAHTLQGMIPVTSANGQLLTFSVPYTTEIIKGINYAFFDAVDGTYTATYGVDNTSPVISNVVATPNGDGTASITWTTDEPATSRVDYGTASGTLNLNNESATLTTSHSITLNVLAQSTQYYFRVTSADAIPNSTTAPIISENPLSFTTPAGPCATDTTEADFTLGTATNTMVVVTGGGGVSLNASINEPFNGTAIPSGWGSFDWPSAGTGTSTVSGGSVTVDGARLNTTTQTFGPGSVMEFVATFGGAAFQYVGFGGGSDATSNGGIYNGENPWAMFGTNAQTNALKARVATTNAGSDVFIDIPGNYFGTPHLYRIEWETNTIKFYIDGAIVHTANVSITAPMRPAISDYDLGGANISVDWIQVSPYVSAGTFTSRIFDAGAVKSWQQATWNATIPENTTLVVSQRQANTLEAIASATWNPIPTNGFVIGGVSQYIQYKVDMTTGNTAITPILLDISFACTDPIDTAPLITTQPSPVTACLTSDVTFTTIATGYPIPTVQWQLYDEVDEVWENILNATNSNYTIENVTESDNGKKYRAIWSNIAGNVTSNPVILTVNPALTATLGAVATACPGATIPLQLSQANGTGPFTIVVNGQTIENVALNTPFTVQNPEVKSIWNYTSVGGPDSNDNNAVEVGVKFQSSVAGYITGIKFYKHAANTGVHTGRLWSSSGALLATITFSNETITGWQTATFSNPVLISDNTTYVASYHAPNGRYAFTANAFFNNAITNGTLTALSSPSNSNVATANGVYKYGAGGVFPNESFNSANYWVDVLFSELNPSELTFDLTSITDANGCTNTGLISTVNVDSESPNGTLTATTCSDGPQSLTFTCTSGHQGPFNVVINGATYTNVLSGVPFASTSAPYSITPASIWNDTYIPSIANANDNSAIKLGVKFRSAVPGTISGIRFFKGASNQSTGHVGQLYKSNGELLASVTFTNTNNNNEGWVQANFTTPVPIDANTTYVASYYSPSPGYFSITSNNLNSSFSIGPLTALGNGVEGPNGVFVYNDFDSFPNGNGSGSNYWADVVFTPVSSYIMSSISTATCTNTVNVPAITATGSTTTWNSIDGFPPAWDNGEPNHSKAAVFQADYTIASDFTACSITVMNGKHVTVNSGVNVFLNGAIHVAPGSSFTLNNNANLLQNDPSAVNTGAIVVKRNSNPLKRLDYTLWSSPVENQNLFGFSPLTVSNRFYRFNTAGGSNGNGNYAAIFPSEIQATYSFVQAKGYLIRLPNNHPTTATIWPGTFNGKPLNGAISIPLALEGNRYNAVGNPYPSTVDLKKFTDDNATQIEPTIYYWRKTNDALKPSYCTFNSASFTFGDNGEAYTESPIYPANTFNAYLQIGQGFIVQAKPAATSVVFNNSQRRATNTNQFFRTSEENPEVSSEPEAHRFWLNMTGGATEFSQTVVGYFTNATQGFEDYDSKYFNDGPIALMTFIDTTNLVIQGRSVPFDVTDVVPLKYKATTAGNYTIAIDHVDGLFTAGGQAIYIKDNLTATIHNLTNGAYTFATAAGTFDNRFEIVYQDTTLGIENPDLANQVVVYFQNDGFVVNAGTLEMKKIKVFDIGGRLIAELDEIYASETKIKVLAAKQVLLLQITTVDDEVVVRKAVNL